MSSDDQAHRALRPAVDEDEGQVLELRREGTALRHYVAGRLVNVGDLLECKARQGWIRGTYDWKFIRGATPTLRTPHGAVVIGTMVRVRLPPS